ncbi:MAG TPA: aminotransferase class I/II-fold pyridoxal phosphate-dependent enzyme [Syntrophomonadaceae bacterium]|nr:aminotransferase class I/II-fold pyridoxal phosphate-dependent enzyme [Syntrophomonadaceae bacterium]
MDQGKTPLLDALRAYVEDAVTPFHVPGHKQGRGIPELREYIGANVLKMDVNGMKELDYIGNPSGVIEEAQNLCADCFGAKHAYFLVNGTSSGVQAMILSVCDPGNEVIIPRNAHKSTIGAIILSGAIPVYVQPQVNKKLGIATGVSPESIQKAITEHPHAKAVFVINPSYYGIHSDLQAIADISHQHNMAVLADEAHGAHLYFHPDFALTAMEAGADMSAVSMHKTGGSMTQSSLLLHQGDRVSADRIKQVLQLSYTSSASYILMLSIDLARKQLATKGQTLLNQTLNLARQVRRELNYIEGIYAFGNELIGTPGCFDFDETKLSIHVRNLGYTGYQIERILREQHRIQMEFSDIYNTLAIISLGDQEEDLQKLTTAFKSIAREKPAKGSSRWVNIPFCPEMIVSPRDAFYSPKRIVPLALSIGEISGEMIMAYPPGIPVICMGERITKDIVEYIQLLLAEGCELQGATDREVNQIKVLGAGFRPEHSLVPGITSGH